MINLLHLREDVRIRLNFLIFADAVIALTFDQMNRTLQFLTYSNLGLLQWIDDFLIVFNLYTYGIWRVLLNSTLRLLSTKIFLMMRFFSIHIEYEDWFQIREKEYGRFPCNFFNFGYLYFKIRNRMILHDEPNLVNFLMILLEFSNFFKHLLDILLESSENLSN